MNPFLVTGTEDEIKKKFPALRFGKNHNQVFTVEPKAEDPVKVLEEKKKTRLKIKHELFIAGGFTNKKIHPIDTSTNTIVPSFDSTNVDDDTLHKHY